LHTLKQRRRVGDGAEDEKEETEKEEEEEEEDGELAPMSGNDGVLALDGKVDAEMPAQCIESGVVCFETIANVRAYNIRKYLAEEAIKVLRDGLTNLSKWYKGN